MLRKFHKGGRFIYRYSTLASLKARLCVISCHTSTSTLASLLQVPLIQSDGHPLGCVQGVQRMTCTSCFMAPRRHLTLLSGSIEQSRISLPPPICARTRPGLLLHWCRDASSYVPPRHSHNSLCLKIAVTSPDDVKVIWLVIRVHQSMPYQKLHEHQSAIGFKLGRIVA